MTFFAVGNEFDSTGQELAYIDILGTTADICSRQYFASQRGDTVIPEYRPDSYDLSGIRIYASSFRQPLGAWDWELTHFDGADFNFPARCLTGTSGSHRLLAC